MDDNTQNSHTFQPVPSIAQMQSQHGVSSSPYSFEVRPGGTGTFENAGPLQSQPVPSGLGGPENTPEPKPVNVVESRNFTYAGETYRGRAITAGQFAAVAMSLSEGGTLMMDTLRLVVSSVVGPDTWKIMFNALASGTATMEDLMGVVSQLSPKSDD